MSKSLAPFAYLAGVLMLVFTAGALHSAQATVSVASRGRASLTGNVQLVIDPASITVLTGQTFTLTVLVQADTQLVDGAQASLDFNPALVQVTQIITNTTLPLILLNQYDNVAGTIDFAAGTFSDFPSGTFALVQIQFAASTQPGNTTLAFHFGLPRDSDVTFGGVSVLGGTSDGAIVVQSPSPTPTASATATGTPTPTATSTRTFTPSNIATLTSTPSNAPTSTLTQTATSAKTATLTPSRTATSTPTPSQTPIIASLAHVFLSLVRR